MWRGTASVYGPIFSWGAKPSLPERYFDSARKNCYANLQNYFARLTPLLVKIPDFGHFISLDGMNSVFSFIVTEKYTIKIGYWLLPEKNVAFARKIMALPDTGRGEGGCNSPNPRLVPLCFYDTSSVR